MPAGRSTRSRRSFPDAFELPLELESRAMMSANFVTSLESGYTNNANGTLVNGVLITRPGAQVNVNVDLINRSNTAAGPAILSARLSRDLIWGNEDDVLIGTLFRRETLPPGQSVRLVPSNLPGGSVFYFLETPVTIPANTPPGFYNLIVRADAAGRVEESDESDNTSILRERIFVLGSPGKATILGGRGAGQEILNDDQVPWAGDGTAFGNAQTFTNGAERTFRIRNDGTGPLSVNLPYLLGNGFEITQPPPGIIRAGQIGIFKVAFHPTFAGRTSAVVTLRTSDPDNPTFRFSVSGNAIPGPTIRVQTASSTLQPYGEIRNLGTTRLGDITRAGFTITNTGTAGLLTFQKPVLTGPGANNFVVISQPATRSLRPGESATFRVRLLTSSLGHFEALLTVPSSDPSQPEFAFNLVGNVRRA